MEPPARTQRLRDRRDAISASLAQSGHALAHPRPVRVSGAIAGARG
jgi:hypothetical protein